MSEYLFYEFRGMAWGILFGVALTSSINIWLAQRRAIVLREKMEILAEKIRRRKL